MNVACGACPAKYVIPDEKVKGRKVRIPCKRCGAAIIVDGTVSPSASAQTTSKAPGADVADAPSATPKVDSTAPPAPAVGPPPTPEQEAKPPSAPAASMQPLRGAAGPTAAARAQRAIRQTIIGVAAPANAPDAQPAQPVRRPTPIYVRAANASPLDSPPAQQPAPASSASGQMRSIRRTMLGGLDTEDAEPGATDGAAEPARPQKRDIKQTIIGGLEAAVGSAPGASAKPQRPIPTQVTPPGIWLAALTDGKTLKVAERDVPRAVKKAYIAMGTPLWRTGMSEWQRLEQIPELLSLVNKSATLPQGASNGPPVPAPVLPKLESPRAVASRTSSANTRAAATEPKRLPVPFSTPPGGQPPPKPLVSKPRPSQAAPPTTASHPPTVPRASTAPVAKLPSLTPGTGPGFSTTKPQVSRGPASVSARSSSPTLELLEIQNDEEIADIESAQASSAQESANGIQALEQLAAARAPSLPLPLGAASKSVELAEGLNSEAAAAASSSAIIDASARVTLPASRRKRSRAPVVLLVLLVLIACLVASYLTRQPRALYGYMHARGWEQSMDRLVHRATGPAFAQLKKWLHR